MTDPPASLRGSLHHVELRVTNFEATVPSWQWLLTELGYRKFQTWSDGISWKLGVLTSSSNKVLTPSITTAGKLVLVTLPSRERLGGRQRTVEERARPRMESTV